jgi:hypothetical protein
MGCKSYVNAILNSLCTYLYMNLLNTKEPRIDSFGFKTEFTFKLNLVKDLYLTERNVHEGNHLCGTALKNTLKGTRKDSK